MFLLSQVGVGLQLDTNVAGDCVVSYIVPDFAAERSGLFGVNDLVLSIDGIDLSGVSSTPIPLRLRFKGTLIWQALTSRLAAQRRCAETQRTFAAACFELASLCR